MEAIAIAIITSVLSLIGVVATVLIGNKKTAKTVCDSTDLTLYRIEQLEQKQDKHNEVIERTYKIEDRLDVIDEKIKVANHRLDDLEENAKAAASTPMYITP